MPRGMKTYQITTNLILFVAAFGLLLWLAIRISEPNAEAVLTAISLISGAIVAILRLLLGRDQFIGTMSRISGNVRLTWGLVGLLVISSGGLLVDFQSRTANNRDFANVKIADWDGIRSFDEAIVAMSGCQDNDELSNISGTTPAYFVIFEVHITFTFVNDSSVGDGIINVEIPNHNLLYDHMAPVPLWYVEIYDPDKSHLPRIQLPIALSPRVPERYQFAVFHLVETQPTVPAISFYELVNSLLSPIVWTFNTLEEAPLVYEMEIMPYVPEALGTGYLDFSDECEALVPRWPLPVLVSQISS